MKYAIIIPEGAADQPLAELADMTPLAAAETPNMDALAFGGRCGTACLAAKRQPHAPAEPLLTLLGYDANGARIGGGPLEALGRGLDEAEATYVMRCNLVTVIDGVLVEARAGNISDEEAGAVVALLNHHLAPLHVTFHEGRGFRHLLSCDRPLDVVAASPYETVGRPVRKGRPKGPDAERVQEIMQLAAAALAGHEINQIRRELGESPITGIWPWDGGVMQPLIAFTRRFRAHGAMIATDPLIRGIGRHIGWETIDIPGADGYTDSTLTARADAAAEALERVDLVCVHVSWADEAALAGDVKAKIAAIEAIDEHVVGPVVQACRSQGPDWRVLLAPTYWTLCGSRQRTAADVPFAIAGVGVKGVLHEPYTEAAAAAADLHVKRGHELMEFFLTVRSS